MTRVIGWLLCTVFPLPLEKCRQGTPRVKFVVLVRSMLPLFHKRLRVFYASVLCPRDRSQSDFYSRTLVPRSPPVKQGLFPLFLSPLLPKTAGTF